MTALDIKELKSKGWEFSEQTDPYGDGFTFLSFKSPRMDHKHLLLGKHDNEKSFIELSYEELMESEKRAYGIQIAIKKMSGIRRQLDDFISSLINDDSEIIDPDRLTVELDISYENNL